MEIVISVDDGRKECLRVADLLRKYGLKGVFYIAPFEKQCSLNVREILELAKHNEIGGHTLTHCRLTGVKLADAKREIELGKEELESIIGKKITKFAYPRGWFNEDLKKMVADAGFRQGRTMKMGITDRTAFDAFEVPVSAQNYPRPEYEDGIYQGVIDKFEEAKSMDGYFNFVIHTDDIKKYGQWGMIEDIFKYISENK